MTTKLLEGRDVNSLEASDVADTILYALSVPQRVNVSKINVCYNQLNVDIFLKRRANRFFL